MFIHRLAAGVLPPVPPASNQIIPRKWCETTFNTHSSRLLLRQGNESQVEKSNFKTKEAARWRGNGINIGKLEFSSQTNHNADCVPLDDRFKRVDDLTVLEIINLLMVGMSSHNFRNQVAADIPIHGQYIQSKDLRTQKYLEEINQWTINQQMDINQKKTKAMIISFTNNHQFTTRLQLKGETVEIVESMKILGIIVTNKLDWYENTALLVKKVNMRMQLLRAVQSFGSSREEMVHLWKISCLSVLEQSCVVRGSCLTCEEKADLERTQKSFAKLVLRDKYTTYESALIELNLENLKTQRTKLMMKFGKSGIDSGNLKGMFRLRNTTYNMEIRQPEKYRTTKAHTESYCIHEFFFCKKKK